MWTNHQSESEMTESKKKVPLLDVQAVRREFPILTTTVNGYPLTYLDNAATTQKPLAVIERMSDFLSSHYGTVHRGIYSLSQEATILCESVRDQCQKWLNARRREEIIFVRGATEAINLVAASYGRRHFREGDEIIISEMEHHANIVPWQQLCLEKKLKLKVIPMNNRGELLLEEYKSLLSDRTVLVAVNHISNALGTINPVESIIKFARRAGAKVLIDGAQGICHSMVDVQGLDCDFYCFSAHKFYGPTGVGVLYAKQELLEEMDPYQCGGEMLEYVSFEKTTFAKAPAKFEAGTPAIAEIIGLGAAIDFVAKWGMDQMSAYEDELLEYATEELQQIEGITIIGTAAHKASVLSFILDCAHPHDIGTILDQFGIAIRAGHHCAQPVMRHFSLSATARASFSFYNTREEIDRLVRGICKVKEVFKA